MKRVNIITNTEFYSKHTRMLYIEYCMENTKAKRKVFII